VKAIEEAGIPIDFIGGTSIGAFIGGLYASKCHISQIEPQVVQWAVLMGSVWSYLKGKVYHSQREL